MVAALRVPFVDLGPQVRALAGPLREAIQGVLDRGDFILGEALARFEADYAAYVGAGHAVGVSSGLDALRLALAVLDVGPGDEVVLPANTYIATALAVSAVGARPALVDCRSETYNLDPGRVEAALSERTRALIVVHLAGQPAEMDPLLAIGERRGLPVIEDAAQAHGACYRGRPCGSLGRLACFSFYPSKNLGAYGDGGMVTTSYGELAERIRRLRNYGQRAKYDFVEPGLNARLDTLQAAMLSVKLPHLADWNRRRRELARRYREQLTGIGDLVIHPPDPDGDHIYHLFIVESGRRDALRLHLEARGVQTGVHYPQPIHLTPAYRSLGYRRGDFPVSEVLADRVLSLPIYPELGADQQDYVIAQIAEFFGAGTASPEAAPAVGGASPESR